MRLRDFGRDDDSKGLGFLRKSDRGSIDHNDKRNGNNKD